MESSWDEFLMGWAPSAHGVQVYGDVEELAASVATYLGAGFQVGEPGVVVATREHETLFREHLAASGWDPGVVEQAGLLTVADAHETLAAFTDGNGSPSPAGFERVVGGILDQVAKRFPHRRIRAFGEMVDLLCERGQAEAAFELEGLWNDLAHTRSFSLLCGYRLDVFDRDAQEATLPDVCRLHSHVLPASDPERLAHAVDRAVEEVLGTAEAGKVYGLVGERAREERVPVPQLVLMWISANMPTTATRILASARAHYGAAPLAT